MIERPATLTLHNTLFSFVKEQRDKRSAIYTSGDTFLRIGEPEKITAGSTFHKNLQTAGFPVAHILEEGELGGEQYYVESSLGASHFGDLFAADTEKYGTIQEDTFTAFLSVMQRFARAQLSTTSTEHADELAKGIWLDVLCSEIPEHAPALRERFARAQENLAELPRVLTHGDCNQFNLHPEGVIDFEDSFSAPYGYDVLSALVHIDSFPDPGDYEYYAKYRFTPEQRSVYLAMLDAVSKEHNLPPISRFLDDFAFCRAVWLAADIPMLPKLQQFRFDFVVHTFLR